MKTVTARIRGRTSAAEAWTKQTRNHKDTETQRRKGEAAPFRLCVSVSLWFLVIVYLAIAFSRRVRISAAFAALALTKSSALLPPASVISVLAPFPIR